MILKFFRKLLQMDSDNRRGLKRKHVNFAKVSDFLYIPQIIYNLLDMSTSERRELLTMLKYQLKQIDALKNRLPSLLNVAVKGMEPIARTNSKTEVNPVGGFKPGKFTSFPPPSSNIIDLLMKDCEKLLNRLMKHKDARRWYNSPVDVEALGIPDYFDIIKQPMDLCTIKANLNSGKYSSPRNFADDVRLTFNNAKTYNPEGHLVHIAADKLTRLFEKSWKPIQEKLNSIDMAVRTQIDGTVKHSQPKTWKTTQISPGRLESETVLPKMSNKQHHISQEKSCGDDNPATNNIALALDTVNMEADERQNLADQLDFYGENLLPKVVKSQIHDITITAGSGHCNSSLHSCRDQDSCEEEVEVDIGGNECLASSYPPVEIEKDLAVEGLENGNTNSFSRRFDSSSSDSDDSSTDSDSHEDSDDSSTASDSDKDSKPGGDVGNPSDANCSTVVVNFAQPSVGPESKSGLHTAEHGHRGNFPKERCVSQENEHQAAPLKSYLSDKFLKASGKTSNQFASKIQARDPEKLCHEGKDLEKQKMEENTRSPAEVKIEAQKTAEADSAAEATEAKQKMEHKRETECQSMLQASFVYTNETSGNQMCPDWSHAGTVNFNLGEAKPLEQLGVYNKYEEEEDNESK